MYRGVKFYEAAVKATDGELGREEVAAALDHAKIDQGPGGGAEMVPGQDHCENEHVHRGHAKRSRQDPLRRDRQSRHGRSEGVLIECRN